MNEVAYVDASPLIFLGRAGLLDVLRLAAARVVVPQVVADEIRAHRTQDPAVLALRDATWIDRAEIVGIAPQVAALDLGAGEAQVLSLAMATRGAVAILDDLPARSCARTHGVSVRGTLGLVLLAKRRGRLPAARPVVAAMRGAGMYLTDALVERVLREAGE